MCRCLVLVRRGSDQRRHGEAARQRRTPVASGWRGAPEPTAPSGCGTPRQGCIPRAARQGGQTFPLKTNLSPASLTLVSMAKNSPASPAPLSPEDRQRILDDLANQQAQQRAQQVAELADLYTKISALRDQLSTAEQTYRSTYRNVSTAGLLTAAQLRTLGLPALNNTSSATKSRNTKPKTGQSLAEHHPEIAAEYNPGKEPTS